MCYRLAVLAMALPAASAFWSAPPRAPVLSPASAAVDEAAPSRERATRGAPDAEIAKRRNFAIISHPDAGKTTITEKLLLYGDAIQEAGNVRARRNQKSSTSDFLKMERERGISISSTCLTFAYDERVMNLLDTPGHADFSEDTYRTLAAADNALMLVDGAKGLEPQTRKLFEVCRLSRLPVFTFVNKFDRPALSPWELMDEIAREFALETSVRTWPLGDGDRFRGVFDVSTGDVLVYAKRAGAEKMRKTEAVVVSADDTEALRAALGGDADADELVAQLDEDREMIRELTPPLDPAKLASGEQTAVFFGSAMSDVGVQPFLEHFIALSAPPAPRALAGGGGDAPPAVVAPAHSEFSGFVFKMQANLDPKHRDCMAYVRIVSGRFDKGMKVTHARSKRQLTLATAAMLFGSGRDQSVESAFPGDVIGLNNPAGGLFAIGDAVHTGNAPLNFKPIPCFTPEARTARPERESAPRAISRRSRAPNTFSRARSAGVRVPAHRRRRQPQGLQEGDRATARGGCGAVPQGPRRGRGRRSFACGRRRAAVRGRAGPASRRVQRPDDARARLVRHRPLGIPRRGGRHGVGEGRHGARRRPPPECLPGTGCVRPPRAALPQPFRCRAARSRPRNRPRPVAVGHSADPLAVGH